MLFNSLSYLIFLPVVAIVLYLVPGRYQWSWLLVCSLFFYYTLLPVYLILLIALVLLNYYLGIAIERSGTKRKYVFIISVCLNILVLAFFKYFGFLESFFSEIRKLSVDDPLLKIILPVGLSFFTFTVLSYLIEIKRGTTTAERHIGIFASSLLFFPKIMQGPIQKPGNIFPQFRKEKSFNSDMILDGLKLMLWGYFKKLVVADRLAIYVNAVYGNYEFHNGISLLLATFFYSMQIYADFSGYTDIALGSAKVLGFNLTNNFNRPYFAVSIKEFWNRWHISFSVWLRDYLFLPLAFYFGGKMNKTKYLGLAAEKWIFLFAAMITFAVCGIWHGEGLNFLIWGLLFGIYLTIANWSLGFNKRLRKRYHISKKSKLYKLYSIIITFFLVSIAWIFFRANTVHEAMLIIQRIFTGIGRPLFINHEVFFAAAIALGILFAKEFAEEFLPSKYTQLQNHYTLLRLGLYALIASIIILLVFSILINLSIFNSDINLIKDGKIYKQFIGKLVAVIIMFWLIDVSAGFVLDHLYARSKAGVSYQEYYIINKTNQELLIFGNSRASFHYIPSIFSKELKLSTYNVGNEGIGIYYYYAVLLATLERYTPKLIILELDYLDVYEGGGRYGPDVLKQLAPFYGKISTEFDSLLSRNWYDPFLFQSNLYKYNTKFFRILTGNIFSVRSNYDGYRPAYGEWPKELKKLEDESLKVDPDKMLCLEKFIETAQRNDIQVILAVSPYYMIMPVDLFEPLEKITINYKITLLNHSSDQRFLSKKDLIKDETHLNDKGARLYSSIVASEIREILSGKQIEQNTIVSE